MKNSIPSAYAGEPTMLSDARKIGPGGRID
jgi:hypothetical protein